MAQSESSVRVPSRFSGCQLAGGSDAALPDAIVDSWRRCSASGLDREARLEAEPLSAGALRQRYQQNDAFRRRCKPDLQSLFSAARATDGIVILTDAEGVILDALGSTGFAGKAAQVALRPGVAWTETATGTNAIGAALVEQRPIAVSGAEHFLRRNSILSCAAAPVRSPQGALLGVLDLSAHASALDGRALGLVGAAVDALEHRALATDFSDCAVYRFHSDHALLGTPREGVLVFRDDRLVAANSHGLGLFGLPWSALHQQSAGALFADERRLGADTVAYHRADGAPFYARRSQDAAVTSGHRPARAAPAPQPAPAKAAALVFGRAAQDRLVRATRLLDAGVPLLVQGETGTGKEVFARAAHAASARAGKPFVAINCTALPESLIEAELFGYEAGAFTGARRAGAKGLLREADGGLLFLDEIGDMPLTLQPRLLRALQEREVVPVGAARAVPIDVDLICATHRDLARMVERGEFRADLYYRIASYTVELPTVRSLGDRAALVRQVWASLEPERRGVTLSRECEAALGGYAWPGNFRQLVSSLRAMLAVADAGETLSPDALPVPLRSPPTPQTSAATRQESGASFDQVARAAMRDALQASGGNVSAAARRLGISRSTLYRRCLGSGHEV